MRAQPSPNDELLTREEFAKLTRLGVTALATRCAMRVAPAFRPREESTSKHVKTGYLAINTCVSAAALVATDYHIPIFTDTLRISYANAAADAANANATALKTSNAAYAAAIYAAYAAAATYSADYATYEDAYAAYTNANTAANANTIATKADYNALLEYNLDNPGSKRNPVPRDFFARPLWPNYESFIPSDWQGVLDKWQKRLADFDLSDIYEYHMLMIHGKGPNWRRIRRDFEVWAREYNSQAGAESQTKKKTLKLDPSTARPIDVVEQIPPLTDSQKIQAPPQPQKALTPEPVVDAESGDTEADLAPPPETSVSETSEALEQQIAEQPDTTTPLPSPPGRIGNPTSHADLPAKQDLLGRQTLVDALAAMIASSEQGTPFTLALLGDWGVGKSSVMKLLQDKLEKTERYKSRFDFAWFNAWEYEHTDNMAAGLAQEVVTGLIQRLDWRQRVRLGYDFAKYEHTENLTHTLLGLVVLIFSISGLTLAAWWTNNQFVDSMLGAGTVAGIGAFAFYAWKNLKTVIQHPLAVQLKTYLKLPDYGEHMGLIPVLKRHVGTLCKLRLGKSKKQPRRLVVFVDDLDRCSPECISRTLDAVRLVMDLKHVIVVVGIDHHIALRAIGEQYKDLADERRSKEDIARDYLGKIIQLPIRLHPSEGKDLENFVHQKLFVKATREAPQRDQFTAPGLATAADTPVETATGDPSPALSSNSDIPQTEILEPSGTDTGRDTPTTLHTDVSNHDSNADSGDASTTPDEPEIDLEQVMHDTHAERDLFHTLADRFGFSNPRQLVRIRNSYRLLKTLDKLQRQSTTPTGEQAERWHWLMQMVFWQEFLYQWPRPVRYACVDALENDRWVPLTIPRPARKVLDGVAESIRATFSISPQHTHIYEQAEGFVRTLILPRGDEAPRPRPNDESNAVSDNADNTENV